MGTARASLSAPCLEQPRGRKATTDEAGETSTAQRACTGGNGSECSASRRSDVDFSAAPARSPRAIFLVASALQSTPAQKAALPLAARNLFQGILAPMGDSPPGLVLHQ